MVTTTSESKNLELTLRESNGVALLAASCSCFFLGVTLVIATIALWIVEALEGRSFHRLEVFLPVGSFLFFTGGAHLMDLRGLRKAKERE